MLSGLVPSTFFWSILCILGALCKGKGVPLVLYLCTTWESLHMFFTQMCPSGGTKHVSLELFFGILKGPGEGGGDPPNTVPLQNPKVTSRKMLNQFFFAQSFSRTLWVMDVQARYCGCRWQKACRAAATVMGRGSLTLEHGVWLLGMYKWKRFSYVVSLLWWCRSRLQIYPCASHWVHQAIAFAIASESCCQHPFTRNFNSEKEMFTISFAKPFADASELIHSPPFATFCLSFGGQNSLANFRGVSDFTAF